MDDFFAFTRDQAEGALPNGTRVEKVAGADEGGQPLGAAGSVIGSLNHPEMGIAYFIEWDAMPGLPVLCIAWKIAPMVAH